ncbi:UNVERIFIED_CONTAM: hypothetical protein K2H54_052085 [Gekko kuhli]
MPISGSELDPALLGCECTLVGREGEKRLAAVLGAMGAAGNPDRHVPAPCWGPLPTCLGALWWQANLQQGWLQQDAPSGSLAPPTERPQHGRREALAWWAAHGSPEKELVSHVCPAAAPLSSSSAFCPCTRTHWQQWAGPRTAQMRVRIGKRFSDTWMPKYFQVDVIQLN